MIVFSNPGTIDVRCITTQGINVKPDETTAIGQFGTGLKVAIAVLLRTGHKVEIYSGNATYSFSVETEEVRGKPFGFIKMLESWPPHGPSTVHSLGFTTDLGKHWETWMAYRELYSNAKDENGTATQTNEEGIGWFTESGSHNNDRTMIVVSGPEIDTIHENRGKYFLLSEPLWQNSTIAIHPVQEGSVFYQGILAGNLEPTPAFAYNIKVKTQLTEDRTFYNIYTVKNLIVQALIVCGNAEILAKAVPNSFEFKLDYNWPSLDLGPTIEALAWQRIRAKESLPSSLRDAMRQMRGPDFDKESLIVPDTLAAMLLHEPEVEKKIYSHSSLFSGFYAMEAEIDQLRKQNDYWKKCIEKLAEQEDKKAAVMAGKMTINQARVTSHDDSPSE